MAYAVLMHTRGYTLLPIWGILLITLGVYLVTSVSRVHFGLIYPSDCILSLAPIMMIVLIWTAIQSLSSTNEP